MTNSFIPIGQEPVRASGPVSRLRAGDWVRVRSREAILATLDANGCLDGMPFMPEMLGYAGRTMRIAKRAHKTCDSIQQVRSRQLERTVHLEDARCDGSAHGGCEAACLLFWNEAWLEPATPVAAPPPQHANGCTMEQLMAATQRGHDPEKGPRYACQGTDYLNATRPLSQYDPRQYIEDWRCGNADARTLFRGAVYLVGHFVVRCAERLGRPFGRGDAIARPLMACYDAFQKLLPDGVPYPRRRGMVPKGQPTPHQAIGSLGPGSRVRVKPYAEILATLDGTNRNRGLYFDAEHVPYCGREFAVRSLVHQIVDERTGYMLRFKSPSIILDGVHCQGTHSDKRLFCPRALYPYWRPIWLTPVETGRGQDEAGRPPGPPVH